jgi:hypothetical protein
MLIGSGLGAEAVETGGMKPPRDPITAIAFRPRSSTMPLGSTMCSALVFGT